MESLWFFVSGALESRPNGRLKHYDPLPSAVTWSVDMMVFQTLRAHLASPTPACFQNVSKEKGNNRKVNMLWM